MKSEVRYFALVGSERTTSNPYNIFREVVTDERHVLERLDLRDPNRWIADKNLGVYLFKGELGAEQITESEARVFVEKRGGVLGEP